MTTYKGKKYATREITVSSPELNEGENTLIVIGTVSLLDALGDNVNVDGSEEEYIDGHFECYIADDDIGADAKYMVENLLEVSFEFICEGEEF